MKDPDVSAEKLQEIKEEWDRPGTDIPFAEPTEYAKYILGFLILNAICTLILLLKSL